MRSGKLLQDAKKGEKPVEDLCRDFGCSPASFYAWKKKYGDTAPDEAKRLRRLEKENARRETGGSEATRCRPGQARTG
ncbi:transposase, partial [Deinococcus daejeonensis]|uniref:transposase n=1 Tax=Deinococcus daejeonensis TaxID=1007098 RepID=UPI00166654DB